MAAFQVKEGMHVSGEPDNRAVVSVLAPEDIKKEAKIVIFVSSTLDTARRRALMKFAVAVAQTLESSRVEILSDTDASRPTDPNAGFLIATFLTLGVLLFVLYLVCV